MGIKGSRRDAFLALPHSSGGKFKQSGYHRRTPYVKERGNVLICRGVEIRKRFIETTQKHRTFHHNGHIAIFRIISNPMGFMHFFFTP